MDDDSSHTAFSPLRFNRRRLVQAGSTAGLAAVLPVQMLSASDRKLAWDLWQQKNPGATPNTIEVYEPIVLSMLEWSTLTAIVNRLFPKDEESPGGADAGAHIYIDRRLSTVNTDQILEYRSRLAAIEASVAGGFSTAAPSDQDSALHDIEAGKITDVPDSFFDTLLEHTRQGMFCDPIHGGNREFLGWDLIGYPGIKLSWSSADQEINADVKPVHISVAQYGGESR